MDTDVKAIAESNKREQEEQRRSRILSLDRFPGSLAEYCQFKGNPYEIIDTKIPRKYITERDLRWCIKDSFAFDLLVDQPGIVALIRYTSLGFFSGDFGCYQTEQSYGVPVRLKMDEAVKS